MSLTNQSCRCGPYAGNNSTSTPYPVTFPFYDASDLLVVVTEENGVPDAPLVLGADFTVTGGNGSTGNVTTTAAIPSTNTLTITRALPFTQPNTYADAGKFPSASVEENFDRLCMQVQQVNQRVADVEITISQIDNVMSGNSSIQTSATGATFVALNSQLCRQVFIVNDTGADLEVQQDGAGVAIPIFAGTEREFQGINSASQLAVRRVDQSNTQVTVKYRWEYR